MDGFVRIAGTLVPILASILAPSIFALQLRSIREKRGDRESLLSLLKSAIFRRHLPKTSDRGR